MIKNSFSGIKNIVICVALFFSIFISAPIAVHAATQLEMLQKIQVLMNMLVDLQRQLAIQKEIEGAMDTTSVLGIFMENLSNPSSNLFGNGTIGSMHGDRIVIGWKNLKAQNCTVTDRDDELTVQGYSFSSETEAQLGIHMPFEEVQKIYYLTLKCTVSGKSVSENVKINYLHATDYSKPNTSVAPAVESKKPVPLYLSPEITATMNVVSIGERSIKVSGVITPPKNCVGTEQMEVELRFSEQNMLSYILSKCEPIIINMSTVYDRSATAFFPELRVRWVNATINTWMYTDLVRYKVDFYQSNSNPKITKLYGGTKG